MNDITVKTKYYMRVRRCNTGIMLVLVLMFLLPVVSGFASESPEEMYNLGVEEYQKGEFENASKSFAKAAELAKDSDIKFKGYYNLGNSAYKQNAFDKAIEAYKSALEIKKDYMAEHNLKKAQEKLEQKQEEEQKQKQENNEGKEGEKGEQNKDNKDGQQGQQGEKGNQGQDNKDGQQGEQGENSQDGQKGEENKDGEQGKDAQQNKEGEQSTDNKDAQQGKDGEKVKDNKDGQQGEASVGEEQRGDVEMAEPGTQKESDVSQKARAMKNIRANPYMIEKILKEMQQREAELQRRARNEGVRQREEADPFEMNAQELHDWMQNRGRPTPTNSDEPDW
ncbi:MAG: tetratricopeptide repeat protein [Candidatus Riflebacteria bacterium]|nr:tetratricopeptide repeat protein [Candidatus Riflebacteria bacterium]